CVHVLSEQRDLVEQVGGWRSKRPNCHGAVPASNFSAGDNIAGVVHLHQRPIAPLRAVAGAHPEVICPAGGAAGVGQPVEAGERHILCGGNCAAVLTKRALGLPACARIREIDFVLTDWMASGISDREQGGNSNLLSSRDASDRDNARRYWLDK